MTSSSTKQKINYTDEEEKWSKAGTSFETQMVNKTFQSHLSNL